MALSLGWLWSQGTTCAGEQFSGLCWSRLPDRNKARESRWAITFVMQMRAGHGSPLGLRANLFVIQMKPVGFPGSQSWFSLAYCPPQGLLPCFSAVTLREPTVSLKGNRTQESQDRNTAP